MNSNSKIAVDPIAKERAVCRAAMPEDFLVPVAAVDVASIQRHIGAECIPIPKTRIGNAYLVMTEGGPEKSALAIWDHKRANVLSQKMQVWVDVSYSGYRKAYKTAFPNEDIRRQVIHHVMNRRYALMHGFRYTRLVAISRSANSSSAFSENWGVTLTEEGILGAHKDGASIRYADIAHILPMLDMPVGGGVMENVRVAAKLVQPE